MARRKITFDAGSSYHIYNRGTDRQPIFRSDENCLFLLRRVKHYLPDWDVTVIAYCLMPNHYHFVLRQNRVQPVNGFMQAVFNSYSKAFNKMYNRTGTLFEGPFQARYVTTTEYLLQLCRYIHRNPLEARLVTRLDDWPYSNYLEWIDQRNGSLVDRDFVRSHFATPAAYAEFVNDEKQGEWPADPFWQPE